MTCDVHYLAADDLRRQILRCTAQSIRALAGLKKLGEAHVGDLQVALGIQQQVLRFEVTVAEAAVSFTTLNQC